MICCPQVYYCMPDGTIVTQNVGTTPPVGFVAGPWSTMAEAEVGCPVPDVYIFQSGGCCNPTVKVPGAVWVTFTEVTGWQAGKLPNSVKIIISPSSGSYLNIYYDGYPPDYFVLGLQFTYGCIKDTNNWKIGFHINVNPIFGYTYYNCWNPHQTQATSSLWTPGNPIDRDTPYDNFSRIFSCSEDWTLSSPEVLGTTTFSCSSPQYNSSFKVTLSR